MKLGLIFFILAIPIALIIVILISTASNIQSSSFDVGSDKIPKKACSIERISYEETEYYDVDFNYEVMGTSQETTLKGFDVWAVGEVKVKNVELETGEFEVIQRIQTLNDEPKVSMESRFIMPGEIISFNSEFDVDSGEDFNIGYEIVPPKKTMSREVTKFKEVEVCN